MLVFYNTATSPNGQKVQFMLEECGLPYERKLLRRDLGENKTPEYLSISPTGAVPAIVDHETGARVFESAAILVYLAEKSGTFLPLTQPARAQVLKWLFYEVAGVGAVCENIYQLMYENDPGPWLTKQVDKLRRAATLLQQQLGDSSYICGECSVVDFALFPWFAMFEDLTDQSLAEYPGVKRWFDTMRTRPAMSKVLAGK